MKDVNWNKGLFRIWIVLSILWIIAWIFDVLPYSGNWKSSILHSLIAPLEDEQIVVKIRKSDGITKKEKC